MKFVAGRSSHSLQVVKLHPNQKGMAGQSLKNQVLLFDTLERFQLEQKYGLKGTLYREMSVEKHLVPMADLSTAGTTLEESFSGIGKVLE